MTPRVRHAVYPFVITDDDAARQAGSLTSWLAAVSFRDRTADQVTELLIAASVEWAQAAGWKAYRHARSVVPLAHSGLHSAVDVGIARSAAAPIVVEVDGSDRQRTLDKLVAEAQQGRVCLWVRWGAEPFAVPPAPVRLVPFPVQARKGPHGQRLFSTPADELSPPQHSGADLTHTEQAGLFDSR